MLMPNFITYHLKTEAFGEQVQGYSTPFHATGLLLHGLDVFTCVHDLCLQLRDHGEVGRVLPY